ncbi:extensin-like [Actinidia eriantha]|uniref:extensin-like n=1 Tax=Actinidia eriantha TaxID=165200 RepID=UPI002587A18E|nr:extensin-like [Actinidia eriantha]
MGTSRSGQLKPLILGLYLCFAALSFSHCDARRSMHLLKGGRGSINKPTNKILVSKHLDIDPQLDASNTQPYVSSPFSLSPYDSLPPIPLHEIAPPFCVYPPLTPQLPPPTGGGYTPSLPPPSSSSTPPLPFLSPPPSPTGPGTVPGPPESIPSPIPNPPQIVPSPPECIPSPNPNPSPPQIVPSPPTTTVPSPPTFVPSPIGPTLNPPYYYEPSPPINFNPSPPYSIPPGPSIFVPSPPVFQPPVVYPPPAVPPPPKRNPSSALWCVAKPTVPDPIIQEAMNYACGFGADCDSILPNGSCFQPDTLLAHASYAFNSYWQRTKVAGGTCEFGGAAMLVTADPSFDGCHFVYY